jgi:catechol 2,3-dioxygenase
MKGFLPEQTRLSQVRLRTAELERAVAFYVTALGLSIRRSAGNDTFLSTTKGPSLIVLTEDLAAQPRRPRTTGLYHFALRYPRRKDLAHALRRLARSGHPLDGASDHGVSEAVYLSDPDGNGIELYTDRPGSAWPRLNGQITMVTESLDFASLLGAAANEPDPPEAPSETDLGHIHLHVADLAAAERFYSEFLGMAVTQHSLPGALFLAAGDYHHHIGVNTWSGKTAAPAGSVGLISYRLEVPVAEILYCLSHRAPLLGYETKTQPQADGNPILQIRDPSGDWLEIEASANATARQTLCQPAGAYLATLSGRLQQTTGIKL